MPSTVKESEDYASNEDVSYQKAGVSKTRQIKRKHNSKKDSKSYESYHSLLGPLRFAFPRLGMFESETQKQLRIDRFWKDYINQYYRSSVTAYEIETLRRFTSEATPSLRDFMNGATVFEERVPFDELFRYLKLVGQLKRPDTTSVLLYKDSRKYLTMFNEHDYMYSATYLSAEYAEMLLHREEFMQELTRRQYQYNIEYHTNYQLSDLTCEISFLLHTLRKNKKYLDKYFVEIVERVKDVTEEIEGISAEDQYVALLLDKNLKIAMNYDEIDYFNYYLNLDSLEACGEEAGEHRRITEKRDYYYYVRKKKNRKQVKKYKGILKSACAACLSPHLEQYNPFLYCNECRVRFHKYCYPGTLFEGYCEPCYMRRNNTYRVKATECQLCFQKGHFLTLPEQGNSGINVHIFCMLINRFWKYEGGVLKYDSYVQQVHGINNEPCSICEESRYTYKCTNCEQFAHPLCAYLQGWRMKFDRQTGVSLNCCEVGVDRDKNEKKRKFILNYKKCVFRVEGYR